MENCKTRGILFIQENSDGETFQPVVAEKGFW